MVCVRCGERPVQRPRRELCNRCYTWLFKRDLLDSYPKIPPKRAAKRREGSGDEQQGIPAAIGTDWQTSAACRGADIRVFFNQSFYAEARGICSRCPVVAQCRAFADATEGSYSRTYVHGVFAGETPGQRVARRTASREISA